MSRMKKQPSLTRQYMRNYLEDQSTLQLLPETSILLFMCISITAFESLYHWNDSDATGRLFAQQNLLPLAFCLITLSLILFRKLKFTTNYEKFGGRIRILAESIVVIITIFLIQFTIAYFVKLEKYAVSQIEIYFFFLNMAIAEEFFFRGFIITVLKNLIKASSIKTIALIAISIENVVAILISSTSFSLSHFGVYGSEPLLLLSTFVSGIVFSIAFIISNNLDSCLAGHLANNLTFLLFTYGGLLLA